MGKRIEADCCFYCGHGPAGLFEVDAEGFPICEGCREAHLESVCEDWFWNDSEDKWEIE
jgi:hypothetical protein